MDSCRLGLVLYCSRPRRHVTPCSVGNNRYKRETVVEQKSITFTERVDIVFRVYCSNESKVKQVLSSPRR